MTETAVIVLAAGMGTRMRSGKPKVLHEAAGRTLLGHVLSAVARLAPAETVVVTAPDAPETAGEARRFLPRARAVVQERRRGTADAVAAARDVLERFSGHTLILCGDAPLILPETLKALLASLSARAPVAVLGFRARDPHGYGRLILDSSGNLTGIREELDASDEEKAINLCNSGIIAIENSLLWRLLPKIGNENAKGEYYLTDLIGLAAREGLRVAHVVCAEEEVLGVNDRAQLAAAEAVLQDRLRAAVMAGGATLVDPSSVFLSADTVIGRDVVIEPWVWIGPGVTIADGVTIRAHCHIEGAAIGPGAQVGPFARLRPQAEIREGARVGNFVEVKKATIEEGAKVNHFTYIGDARVGARANVGAGTITCNYDGFSKHFTDIGEEAFIGSNSSLVAPVRIGAGAYVGSGSVITRDVSPGALAVGRARQTEKPGWAERFRRMIRGRGAG